VVIRFWPSRCIARFASIGTYLGSSSGALSVVNRAYVGSGSPELNAENPSAIPAIPALTSATDSMASFASTY
jgi:hypothetical protein